MTIDITHARNPALAWDVTTNIATTAKAEKITHVRIEINNSAQCDKDVDPPADFWKSTLIQKGIYPGENRAVVTATNNQGDNTIAISEWS